MSFLSAKLKIASIHSAFLIGINFFVVIVFSEISLKGQILDVNFSDFTPPEIFENNHYGFRPTSDQIISLSTSIGFDYNGTELFNNGASGVDEYLVFSPTQDSNREWTLYDVNNTDHNFSLTVLPARTLETVYSQDLNTGDNFGYDISINDWNETIVGAPGESTNKGAVYIFRRDISFQQLQKQKIFPVLSFEESNRTKFGAALDVSGADLIIGAPDSNDFKGKVYHYRRDDDNYTKINEIVDFNGSVNQQFGYNLTFGTDENEIFVSSPHEKNAGVGKVIQFLFNGSSWIQKKQFWSSDDRNITGDSFGKDLAVDENFLVIGAPNAQIDETVSGLVYVFQRDEDGNWTEPAKVLAPQFLSDGDEFGHKVEIVDDIIFVASKNGDDGNRSDVGLVYVFEYDGNGNWVEKSVIAPPNASDNQNFSHDISAIDNLLTVGTTGIGSGCLAYVYEKGQDASDWNLISTLETTDINASDPNLFAVEMRVGEIAVGMPFDNSGQELGGAVQSFLNNGWQNQRLDLFPPMFARSSMYEFTLEEDSLLGFQYDFNASHPFDTNFSWGIENFDPSTGFIEFNNSSGVLSYRPAQDFYGSFDLQLNLAVAEGNVTKNLSVIVLPQPDPPVFEEQNQTLPYAMVGDEYFFEVNATDVDGDDLNFVLTPSDLGLSFEDNKIIGTPLENSVGEADFIDYTLNVDVTDGDFTRSKNFFLTIFAANSAPRFTDAYGNSLNELFIELPEDFDSSDWQNKLAGISLTDDDPSNKWFSLTVENQPSNGVVLLDPNSTENNYIHYQPALHFHGSDQFSIRLTDSNTPSKSSILDIYLTITPVNDPPIFSSSPGLQVSEGQEFRYELDVFDPDQNDSHSFFEIQMPDWLALDEGVLLGTPSWSDYSTTPHFVSIGVMDSLGDTGVQEFGISVIPLNYPPVIDLGESIKVVIDEDENPRAWHDIQLVVSDPDTEINLLEWNIIELPRNGRVSLLEGDDYDFLNYEPDGNFTGTDFFILELKDTSDSTRRKNLSVEVIVESVEDAPVFSPRAIYTDAVIGYEWEYSFDGVDGDVGQSISVFATTTLPNWLNLDLVPNNGKINARLYGVPNFGDLGLHDVGLRIEDELGSGFQQSITINVIHGNFLPQINEDDNKSFEIVLEDSVWERENPLSVYDENNQKLVWVISKEPSNGSVFFNSSENGKINFLRYTPDGNFSGEDSCTLSVSDGIAVDSFTYFFEIPNVNDIPMISNEDLSISLKEGDYYEFDILFNDGDGIESTELDLSVELPNWISMSLENYQEGLINLRLDPQEFDEGNHSITFTIGDGESSDEFVLDVEVYVLNYAPTLNKEEIYFRMKEDIPTSWFDLGNSEILSSVEVSDLENNDTFFWDIFTPPLKGSAFIGDSFTDLTYIPDGNFSGTDTFIISVTDAGTDNDKAKSDFLIVNVEVAQVDDAPVFRSKPLSSSNRENIVSWSDETEYFYRIETFDADWPFFGEPTLSLNSVLPGWLTFVPEDNASGYLKGLPTVSDEGTYRINFKVSDENGSESVQDFLLHIIIDDYPPRFESNINNFVLKTVSISIKEDQHLENWLNPANFQAINPDREPDDFEKIHWSIDQDSKIGSELKVSGNGGRPSEFFYSPPKDFYGFDQFVLRMDEGDRFGLLRMNIEIQEVPDSPTFLTTIEDPYVVEEGTLVEIKLDAFDPDDEKINFQLISPVWDVNPWAHLEETGIRNEVLLSGIPKVNSNGNLYPYKILAIDDSGRFDQLTVNFFVQGYNRKPSISLGTEVTIFFSESGEPTNFDLSDLIAIDPEGDNLVWNIAPDGNPKRGNVELIGNGPYPSLLKYFPSEIDVDEDKFTLQVSDGAKFEEITVFAKMVWEGQAPLLNLPAEITIQEGEAFWNEVTVGTENYFEQFIHYLGNAPDWVKMEQNGSFNSMLYGEAPLGSQGEYILEYEVLGQRSLPVKDSFILSVKGVSSPLIRIEGDPLIRLSKSEVFDDPGYSIVDSIDHGLQVKTTIPAEYDDLGFKRVRYEFTDDNFSEIYSVRKIKRYEKCPLAINSNYLSLSHESGLGFDWSRGESINFWTTQSLHDNGNTEQVASLEKWQMYQANHSKLTDFQSKNSFLGRNLKIFDLVELADSTYLVAGSFSHELNVGDRVIMSDEKETGFVMNVDKGDEVLWIKTFGGEVEFNDFRICNERGGILKLGGSFLGSFTLEEISIELSTGSSNNTKLFALEMDGQGRLQKAVQSNDNYRNLGIVDFHQFNGVNYITANEINDNNFSNCYIFQLSTDFQIFQLMKLSGSSGLSINDSCIDKGTFFLGGEYEGLFTVDENILNENNNRQGYIIGVNVEDTEPYIQTAKFFDATICSRVDGLCVDYWGDLFVGLSFEGEINLLSKISSNGQKDLILAKLKKENANLLWTKHIGGEGNEKFYGLESNSVGGLLLGLQSDLGFQNDGITYLQNDQMKSVCLWTFTSELGVPVIEAEQLVLRDRHPFFYKVDSIHASEVYYQILGSPDWISYLPKKKTSNTAHFYIEPNLSPTLDIAKETPFIIRAFNLEGDFKDLEIELLKSKEDASVYGEFPTFDENFKDPLEGEGEVLAFKKNGDGEVYIINKAKAYRFNGEVVLNSDYSSLITTIGSNKSRRTLQLQSTNQVIVTDAVLNRKDFYFVCGNFKEKLIVNEKSYYSNGGFDFFVLKMDTSGQVIQIKTFGGPNDDLVQAIALSEKQLLIGGDFSLSTHINNKNYNSTGTTDCFLMSLDKVDLNDCQWVRVFGGNGSQFLSSITVDDYGEIYNCCTTRNYNSENNLFSSMLLRKTGLNGELKAEFHLETEGRLRNGKVKWIPYTGELMLLGEFENRMKWNDKEIFSEGGFDLFVASMNRNFLPIKLAGMGGPLNDRLSDFAIESPSTMLISGTFYEEMKIGSEILSSNGSSDSVLTKFNYDSFSFHDVLHLGSVVEDRIDALSINSASEIYFAGSSIHSLVSNKKDIFVSRLMGSNTGPRIIGNYPSEIPCSRSFEFRIRSDFWDSEAVGFKIVGFDEENSIKWLNVNVAPNSDIIFTGISPSIPTEVPFDFNLESSAGDKLEVKFLLKISNSTTDFPLIVLPAEKDFFQYNKHSISFRVDNLDLGGLVNIDAPDWISFSKSETTDKYEISFFAGKNTLGRHKVDVTAIGSNGLMQRKTHRLSILPSLNNDSESETSNLIDGWSDSWFGSYFNAKDAWCYHSSLRWIYISPSEDGLEVWFWKPSLGWLWTQESLWKEGAGSYVFSATNNEWIFIEGNIYYDYSMNLWVKY